MLSERLQIFVDYALKSKKTIFYDVCCDHALVALELEKKQYFTKLYAVDQSQTIIERLKKRHQNSAVNFVAKRGQELRIENALVLIAGVGLATVIKILEESSSSHCDYIISSHTHSPKLRYYLQENFYQYQEGKLIKEGRHFYDIVSVGGVRPGRRSSFFQGKELQNREYLGLWGDYYRRKRDIHLYPESQEVLALEKKLSGGLK